MSILDSTDDQGTKKLKYKCNTTKTLEMNRVFLTEKDKAEKGTEKEVKLLIYCSERILHTSKHFWKKKSVLWHAGITTTVNM